MEQERPQAITSGDRFYEYWMERLVTEQEKTNALLLQLLEQKQTRKVVKANADS